MVDYDQGTGSAGTLRIRDQGAYVEYWIYCSDPATYTGSLSWSATGTAGGTVALSPGFGQRMLGAYLVSSTQNVTLSIGASGTMGLGGPSSITRTITRSGGGGGGASEPSTPPIYAITEIGQRSMRFNWGIPSNGGAAIDQMLLRYSTDPALPSGNRVDIPLGPTVTTKLVEGLTPGVQYYGGVYAHNSQGYSSRSAVVSAHTLVSGAYLGENGVYSLKEIYLGEGGSYVPAKIFYCATNAGPFVEVQG